MHTPPRETRMSQPLFITGPGGDYTKEYYGTSDGRIQFKVTQIDGLPYVQPTTSQPIKRNTVGQIVRRGLAKFLQGLGIAIVGVGTAFSGLVGIVVELIGGEV